MIIWFMFMVFYCFGKRKPTENMATLAAISGVAEIMMIEVPYVLATVF